MLAVGTTAPDFTLKDQSGNEVSLSGYRGTSPVVLVFYPFTFSGVCQGELCELRDNPGDYTRDGAQVIALSCDSRFAQAQWAEAEGFDFPVLSDFWPHGAVAKAYEAFNEDLGCANRVTYIIDAEGKIVSSFATGDLGTTRDKTEYAEALAKLG